MTDLLTTARNAAKAASADLLDRFTRPPQGLSTKSAPTDYVSDADRASESIISPTLLSAFPHDGFLGEESGQTATGQRLWIMDPLDGTANYLLGLPFWAISIAAQQQDQIPLGLIACPPLSLEWSARNHVLYRQSQPFTPRCRPVPRVTNAAVNARANLDHNSLRGRKLAHAFHSAGTSRYFGSAALSLAWLAEGSLDLVYFEYSRLSDWDTAAGIALCNAAGLAAFWLPPAQPDLPRRFVAGPRSLVDEWLDLTA